MGRFVRLAVFAITLGAASISFAQNDCNAKVEVKPVEGKSTAVFRVSTDCANSSGDFEYTYVESDNPNQRITRRSQPWNASDGRSFTLKDTITPATDNSQIAGVKVVANTIRSKKH